VSKRDLTQISDCLRSKHTDENCVTVKGLRREDHNVKVCEIAEVASFAKTAVHEMSALKTYVKCFLAGFLKCPLRNTKAKNGCFASKSLPV
jgi:hypothetical protein